MALADARAICPELTTRPADLAQETAALSSLRRWASRYSPMVATDGADGLLADISGVPHLFGGEEALRDDLQARLDHAGLAAMSAIAGTRGGAHALARHGGGIAADGRLRDAIGHLPVTALRVDHETAQALARMGLATIADLIPVPRAPLAKRFGPELMLRLDQALGAQAEPVAPESDPPHFGVRMTLPEPIGLREDVMAGLMRLLERLCETLALHRRGARRVRLELGRVDRGSAQIEIGLARPMRDPKRIAALFAKGVDEVDAGYGIDSLRLAAVLTEDLAPEQVGIGPQTRTDDALADLFSSIGNRIGFDRVLRLLPAESLIPERSFLLAPAAYSSPQARPKRPPPRRPMTLFPAEMATSVSGMPPASFRWRRMRFTTLRANGPERISPEWWFDDPNWRSGLRDYWRIETQEGPRLWLFVTPQAETGPQWYVQGEFA